MRKIVYKILNRKIPNAACMVESFSAYYLSVCDNNLAFARNIQAILTKLSLLETEIPNRNRSIPYISDLEGN